MKRGVTEISILRVAVRYMAAITLRQSGLPQKSGTSFDAGPGHQQAVFAGEDRVGVSMNGEGVLSNAMLSRR